MKRLNKLTAVLLAAAMTLGVTGATAWAKAAEVAKVGKTKYETVQKAIDSVDSKGTVVLIDDTSEDINIPEGKTIILDLNGNTLTNKSDHTITNKGILTITGDGTVDNITHAKAAVYNDMGAEAVLEDCEFTRSKEAGTYEPYGSGGNSYYVILNHGTMTIDNCVVAADGGFSSLIENGWQNGAQNSSKENSVLTINSGNFSGGINTIKNDEYGELVINDGTFENVVQAAFLNWNVAEVNGGTFESEQCAILNGKWNDVAVGELTINGGTFNAGEDYEAISAMSDSKGDGLADVVVTSGTFTSDVSEFMDDDSVIVVDEDGEMVIMTEDEYEDYLDDKNHRGSSYSLEEKKGGSKKPAEEEPVVEPKEEEEELVFTDVTKADPNFDAIMTVYENGWMAGIGDSVFAPNGTLTRGMGATVLWNKAGCPEPTGVAPFLDVVGDAWYAKAVAWAYEQGIVVGHDASTFGPNDSLTVEQFEIMASKASGEAAPAYTGMSPNATRGWVAGRLAL